jgi:hypothetical protein
LEIFCGVTLPDQFSICHVEARDSSLCSKCVTMAVRDQRCATRSIAVTIGINVACRIRELPMACTVLDAEGFNDFLFSNAMKEKQFVANNGGRAVSGPDSYAPVDGRALGGELVQQSGFHGSAVAIWTKELGPVAGLHMKNPGCEREGQQPGCEREIHDRSEARAHTHGQGLNAAEMHVCGHVKNGPVITPCAVGRGLTGIDRAVVFALG